MGLDKKLWEMIGKILPQHPRRLSDARPNIIESRSVQLRVTVGDIFFMRELLADAVIRLPTKTRDYRSSLIYGAWT